MKAKIFISIALSLSVNSYAKEKNTDISCVFEKLNLIISIQDFKTVYKTGTSPLLSTAFQESGKTSVKRTNSAVSMSRGSWVVNDLEDQRPAALVNFENNRLVIYYCSGDGTTVEAKFFTGSFNKQIDSSFSSTSPVALGICSGENLTSFFTTDCSAFK